MRQKHGATGAVRALKAKIGYEEKTPTCASCGFFKPAGAHLVNSLPRGHNAQCSQFHFTPKPSACCDHWKGADGSALDGVFSRDHRATSVHRGAVNSWSKTILRP
jgi:hypothetical protein